MTRLIVKSIACALAAGALLAFRTPAMAQLPDNPMPADPLPTGPLLPGESDLLDITISTIPAQGLPPVITSYELVIPETPNEGNAIIIPTTPEFPNGIPGDPTQFGKPTVLLDPGNILSDVVGVVKTANGGFVVGVWSDSDNNPIPWDPTKPQPSSFFDPAIVPPPAIPESDLGVGVSLYAYYGGGVSRVTDLTFYSDVPDSGATTGVLLGAALLGLAGLRRSERMSMDGRTCR